MDTLLGQVTVEAKSTDSRKTMVSELSNRSGERMAGRMTLEYQTEEDLDGIWMVQQWLTNQINAYTQNSRLLMIE